MNRISIQEELNLKTVPDLFKLKFACDELVRYAPVQYLVESEIVAFQKMIDNTIEERANNLLVA